MTNDLYWVSVLGYIVITLTILIRERKYIYHSEKAGRVFMPLVCISLTFFVVDFFWGMCLVKAIRSDAVYYASSALLHVLAVVTTLSWLCYVLQYIRCPRRCRYVIQFVSTVLLLSEVVLVIANFFSPVLFRIVDGEYVRCKYALVTAFNIYSVFAVVLLGTLFTMMRRGIGANGCTRCKAVLFSSLIPLLPGIMQVKYFASPFFSMGFMLSVLILYVFVVTATREKLYQSKTKFLQNMSHEIRTSLNMVYGFAQLLGMPEGSWTDEEREKYNTYINGTEYALDSTNPVKVTIEHRADKAVFTIVCKDAKYLAALRKEFEDGVTVEIHTYPKNLTPEVVWGKLKNSTVKVSPASYEHLIFKGATSALFTE